MDSVICIKKNGKVKLVDNQFDLNALERDKYLVYLYPTGVYSSVFKPINPQSGWTRPIKKARIIYSVNAYAGGSYQMGYDEAIFDEGESRTVEFESSIELVAFINSLEKLTSINIIKDTAFEYAIFFDGFHMEITDINGNTREFDMTRKKAKKYGDMFHKIGFGVPALTIELMDFLDDMGKNNFTKPYVFNQNYIYIRKDFKEWKKGDMSNTDKMDWLVTVPLIQVGACTLVRSDIMFFMSAMHYSGKLELMTYSLSRHEEEDNLPFECPLTADLISENIGVFFEVYEDRSYNLLTASDIIEAATMAPYYIKSSRYLYDLRVNGDDEFYEDMGDVNNLIQIKLFPSMLTPPREVDPPPLKYMIYESEIEELDLDQSLGDFVKTLLLWVDHPVSVDGLDYLEDEEPF